MLHIYIYFSDAALHKLEECNDSTKPRVIY